MGGAAVMAARVADCAPIVAVDINDFRLELARGLGATACDQLQAEDVAERLREITEIPASTTLWTPQAFSRFYALGVRGTVALVGAAKPGTEVSFEIGPRWSRAGPSRLWFRPAPCLRSLSRGLSNYGTLDAFPLGRSLETTSWRASTKVLRTPKWQGHYACNYLR
ncbi:zinc-binding dehydrogenase [Arthrobacter sp. AK04]|uniref:zinc-binding dehydrogenase n=1 Tax=Arthrobacter sp. AK04 TaxID=2900048 RepID=UPI0035ABA562